MMQHDDTTLIDRVLEGDIQGYSVLVDRHKDLAFTIAYRLLNNREDAEEVVQDAFLKAYRNLKGFRQDSRFSTWLFRIVYNTAISKKRLRKPGFQSIDDVPCLVEKSGFVNDEDDLNAERRSMLERAIKQLPEDERAMITLFYINESTVEDIHIITGLSKSNVKIKLFRARKKLQEFVEIMTEKICI
jgi:RNA polymerase sigma factor (sigma-70 family)